MEESTTAPGHVGVVDGDRADAYADVVERAGASALVDDARGLADADVDAVVAPTEAATFECVRERVAVPTLNVDATPSLRGVARADAEDAVASLVAGDYGTTPRRTLAVTTGAVERRRALADVTLVTDEPARISEYGLHARTGTVGTFRADGVVLATPAGSQGYARAAGSHVLAPRTGVLAAVPIAPFATSADDWVVPDDDVTLTVERDEGDVALRVDDRQVTRLHRTDAVDVEPDADFTAVATPQSSGPWRHALEKL